MRMRTNENGGDVRAESEWLARKAFETRASSRAVWRAPGENEGRTGALMRGWACAASIVVLIGAAACNRRTEPYLPPDKEPPAPARPVVIPTLATPGPARVPGVPQRGMPPTRAAAPAAASNVPADPSQSLRGTVRLADGVEDPGEGVLFIIVRNTATGPPLASLRLPVGEFPLEFEIGPANVMIPGRPFEGALSLSARIDRDGNPMTRQPEDLVGDVSGTVEPGASGLEIALAPSDG